VRPVRTPARILAALAVGLLAVGWSGFAGAQTVPLGDVPTTTVPPTVPVPPSTSPTTGVPAPTTTTTTTPRPVPTDPGSDPASRAGIDDDQLRAGVELGRLTDRIRSVSEAYEAAVAERDEVQRDVDRLGAEIADLEAQVEVVRRRIQEEIGAVYQQRRRGPLAELDVVGNQDFGSGRTYVDATVAVDQRLVTRLTGMQGELSERRARRSELRSALAEATNALAIERQRLDSLRGEEQTLLDRWGGLTMLGPSLLTPQQIADWFEATGVRPDLPAGVSILELAGLFVDEGRIHGVRGDVAFAQSIIETGSFTEYSYNNFSGIGWCDSCTTGHRFDTPRDGVRAQVQLLRDYADVSGHAADIPVPLSPALFGGDPVLAAQHYDTFFLKGKVVFWNQMGGGNWATDPYYAGKVLGVYSRMLASTARRG
jgi:hypothetical protein